ncbi:MAG TPA: nucleoside hydrolase, partial [Armatimonadota bacterium]|nr:nucleoside hydrolase [Armatimonadota bacterium]
MKHALVWTALLAAVVAVTNLPSGAARRAKPAPVILDTDIGPDVDDAGTVAVLNALADRGEARILAMGACTSSQWAAPCLDALNTYYGRPGIPVGTFKGTGFLADPKEHEKYNRAVAERFPNDLKNGANAPDAAALYRRVLARQPDRSVVFCAVGPLNNLSRLLDSGPDRASRLSGTDLVARKVKLLSVMGGRYPEGKEWNFEQDPAAAARVM